VRAARGIVLLLVAAGLMTGCGESTNADSAAVACPKRTGEAEGDRSLRRVDITSDGKDGPENAAILMAAKCGYFADAGLTVTVTSPGGLSYPLFYVATRTVDVAVSHQPQVAIAAAKGVPVIAIGSLISQPTAAMIWLRKSEISDIADLKGKTIAIPGLPFQREFLRSILAREGMTLADVNVEVVGYELLTALTSGKADAIFGGSTNLEGAALEARGLEPVITPVQRLGIPDYDELVMIARPDFAAENPELVRGFMTALARGRAAAVADPGRVRKMMEGSAEAYFELDREQREAEIKATLPLLSESGHMDPRQAERLVDWMHGQGLVHRRPPASALLTNRYLEPAS
jgi:putative hydroxymethylpyrimidine transport system substrate-binding protein